MNDESGKMKDESGRRLDERTNYTSFLLRLWRMPGAAEVWSASLENPRTGERLAFVDMESLFVFLVAHTAARTQHHHDEAG
jgi:hypothetical protein